MAIINLVPDVLQAVISWFGVMLQALLGTAGAEGAGASAGVLSPLLPLMIVGLVVSVIMVTFKIIRRSSWGM